MAKVYFCGSIRAGRQDADLYKHIIQKISSLGVEVLTEFVGWDDKKLMNEQKERRGLDSDKAIHDKDIMLLESSDAVVAEVTQPSLGVGYEIGRAVAMDKRILCLYRPQPDKQLSAMIGGADNADTFVVKHYKVEEVDTILEEFVSTLSKV